MDIIGRNIYRYSRVFFLLDFYEYKSKEFNSYISDILMYIFVDKLENISYTFTIDTCNICYNRWKE